jgi:hypothetical protein
MEDKEMTRSNSILEEYRKGDLDKRLNLFLEWSSLRSRFLEIDESETAAEPVFFKIREKDLEGKEF